MKEWIINAILAVVLSGAGISAIVIVLRGWVAKLGDKLEAYLEAHPAIDPVANLADDIIDKGIAYLKVHYADKDWVKIIDAGDKLWDVFATEAGLRDDIEGLIQKTGSQEKALGELKKRTSPAILWHIGESKFDGDGTVHTI